MSEDEVEKFEITDYDLENEFDGFRNRRRPTKNQQIYGIWADDDSDEDDRRRRNRTTGEKRSAKNYAAPIGFVAGGVQQSGGEKRKNNEITTASPSSLQQQSAEEDDNGDLSDSSEELERPRFGRGGGPAIQEMAGLRTMRDSNSLMMNRGLGNWEKHTKGIGAKLLLQMGFQPGKGLGKDLQGISAPVEAHLRKGRGAIGAYGPEKAPAISKLIQEKKSSIKDLEEGTGKNQESKWKKESSLGGYQKIKYQYRSVDDVIEKGKRPGTYRNVIGGGHSSQLSKVKVIDMTGPQQRVLSGYHALSGPKAPPGIENYEDVVRKKCSNFTLPEIQHNLDLLVDLCERDIVRIDRTTRHCKEKMAAWKHEEAVVHKTLEEEQQREAGLHSALDFVQQMMDPSKGLSLGQFARIFEDLWDNHPEEYRRHGLGDLAPSLVGPLITSALVGWRPLLTPNSHVQIFVRWKDVLEKSSSFTSLDTIKNHHRTSSTSTIFPYDILVWHSWLPVIEDTIRGWNPRDCDPAITLVETWKPLVSSWIMDHVINRLILVKIVSEVNTWNPLTDTLPIHLWIHPWIPLMEQKLLSDVYPLIQEKLGAALTNWHPSDRSAKLMLEPWRRALPEGVFVSFLVKHIVPKLQISMQNLEINPHRQHLDAWHWVMDWSETLSVATLTLILDKFFFPRWLQALAAWLNRDPDYSQVTDWYSGWKRMMSEQLLAQPTIKDNFRKALEMMNRAVAIGGRQPGAQESVTYLSALETDPSSAALPQQQQHLQQPLQPPITPQSLTEAAILRATTATSRIPQGFKDLVARRCEEHGILFVPITNKYHEAKQVYRLGTEGVQCYIERDVIFYSKNNTLWHPISLTRLLDIA